MLLATFNGASYLEEQIASLLSQDIERLDVLVCDDQSSDDTPAVLARWQVDWPKGEFTISRRQHVGFSDNFRRLAIMASSGADYVAFCDQDDIWDPDKLSVAIAALAGHIDRPAVYFSRTRLVDANGRPYGHSPLFELEPSFRNAIVQSIGGGNTMVLNAEGFRLFARSARRTSFVAHDWWGYLIVSGAGGYVHYDPEPHISYRQHANNAVGSNMGWRARATRLRRQFGGGVFAKWNNRNITGLVACADMLSPTARETLGEFIAMRRFRLLSGVSRLKKSGIRRQTVQGNIALAVAVALGLA